MAQRRKTPTIQIYDGSWYAVTGYTHEECCSCGHTHSVEYKMENGRIYVRLVTDPKATAAARRKHGIKVIRQDAR